MKKFTTAFMLCIMSILSSTVSASEEEGRTLFETRCGEGCHQLPDPAMLKAKQWQRVIVTMQKRMKHAGMTPLSQEEQDQIMVYLTLHARK